MLVEFFVIVALLELDNGAGLTARQAWDRRLEIELSQYPIIARLRLEQRHNGLVSIAYS